MKYGMPACNDPTCPLNRQGVGHEMHEEIERQEITRQCNDPRCAMNRMGMIHNVHDKSYAGMQNPQKITKEQHDSSRSDEQSPTKGQPHVDFTIKREGPNPQEITKEQHELPRSDEQSPTKGQPPVDFTIKREWPNPQESEQLARHIQRMKVKQEEAKAREQVKNETDDGDANDALYELLRNISNESQKSQGRPQADTSGRQKTMSQQRTHAGTGAQTANTQTAGEQGADKPSEEESVLMAKNPHKVFGLSRNSTCDQIKSRYKELAKTHNSSRGRINKSKQDNERADAIMSNINKAYSNLKTVHGCR